MKNSPSQKFRQKTPEICQFIDMFKKFIEKNIAESLTNFVNLGNHFFDNLAWEIGSSPQ